MNDCSRGSRGSPGGYSHDAVARSCRRRAGPVDRHLGIAAGREARCIRSACCGCAGGRRNLAPECHRGGAAASGRGSSAGTAGGSRTARSPRNCSRSATPIRTALRSPSPPSSRCWRADRELFVEAAAALRSGNSAVEPLTNEATPMLAEKFAGILEKINRARAALDKIEARP